jgi:hypothetical protein
MVAFNTSFDTVNLHWLTLRRPPCTDLSDIIPSRPMNSTRSGGAPSARAAGAYTRSLFIST